MYTLEEIAALRQKCDELQQFRHIWLAERK